MLASKTLANGNLFKVMGGLHYITGNKAPYFSLTYDETKRGRFEACGAGHVEILKHFPQFADLAALHLCDIDGAPMHALENGFYHLGGTKWQGPDFGAVARHFRITETEAENLARHIFKSPDEAKARLALWIKGQLNRWKGEAMACIAAHGLRLYGDTWS